jgi:phosphate starvation-inducible PhoH-like protein
MRTFSIATLVAMFLFSSPRATNAFLFRGSGGSAAQRGLAIWSKRSRADGGAAAGAVPKTPNQKVYQQYLNEANTNIVLCVGPAGSGKTALACHYAISQLKLGTYKKIVITRPVVTVEEEIGFLPGNLNKKMEPWTRPIMDIFQEYYSATIIQNMLKENQIEISPLAFMRGRTFKDAIIIADEMQNSSPNQMLMLTTRIGDGSKIIITGDLKQSDNAEKNGLKDLLMRFRRFSGQITGLADNMKMVEMDGGDIVRHPIVEKILTLYESGGGGAPAPPPAQQILRGDPFVYVGGGCGGGTDDCAMIPIAEYNRTLTAITKRTGSGGSASDTENQPPRYDIP